MRPPSSLSSVARIHVIRLSPGDDLKNFLQELATANKWAAAIIVTCVGSLVQYNLRYANRKEGHSRTGHFEILSLVGTLSQSSAHLHLSIADEKGQTTGGHLLAGNIVYTTAEIGIAELPDLIFERALDAASGYHELRVTKR